MIIPEWLKDELGGKKYTPKGPASIIDKGVRTTWEIPGLLIDFLNRDRGKGLKGGLAPRLSNVRRQDAAIREAGALGIGGTEQTRPTNYLAPTTKDILNADKIDKVITPPTTVPEEQMTIKSREGVSNTLKAMEGDPRGNALRTAVEKDPSLALQKEGKPNLGWSTVFDTVDADGQPQVLTRNQRKAWEMKNQDLAPKPEPPSAVNPTGEPSNFNKDTGPWKGNAKLPDTKGIVSPESFAEIPKGLDLSGKQFGTSTPNTDISQASAQAFDGSSAGTAAGLNTVAAVAKGLDKLMNKPKEKAVMIPGLHESKDVQLVAAANPWDEFANLMG